MRIKRRYAEEIILIDLLILTRKAVFYFVLVSLKACAHAAENEASLIWLGMSQ